MVPFLERKLDFFCKSRVFDLRLFVSSNHQIKGVFVIKTVRYGDMAVKLPIFQIKLSLTLLFEQKFLFLLISFFIYIHSSLEKRAENTGILLNW